MLHWVKREVKQRGKVVETLWLGVHPDTQMVLYTVEPVAPDGSTYALYDHASLERTEFLSAEAAMKYADGSEAVLNTGLAEGPGCRPSMLERFRRWVTGEKR